MKKYELSSRPIFPCPHKIGDSVIYTNEYGVSFEMRIIGFSSGELAKYKRFIHLAPPMTKKAYSLGAWWFPVKLSELKPKYENNKISAA